MLDILHFKDLNWEFLVDKESSLNIVVESRGQLVGSTRISQSKLIHTPQDANGLREVRAMLAHKYIYHI